jgi:hypothetical protein
MQVVVGLHRARLVQALACHQRPPVGWIHLRKVLKLKDEKPGRKQGIGLSVIKSCFLFLTILPAFGIVAAIIGVIHTLGTISAGKSPGEIGANIASALTGTLMGVFSAYAVFSPISRTLDQKAEEDLRPFEAIKEILVANYSNFSPVVAVEYGRKVLYSDQRPSMIELEAGVQSATGSGMRD